MNLAGSVAMPADPAEIAALCRDARVVLIGEATHGTHDFYSLRGEITRVLLEDHGFAAVAAEADWPDSLRVNRYVNGSDGDATAADALGGFARFPQWMWRNTFMVEFVEWLRDRNARARRAAGFYGLDLYSMFSSMEAVVEYLAAVDPEAADRVRRRYACFDWSGRDAQRYGYEAVGDVETSCEDDVVRTLMDLQARRALPSTDDADEEFFAEQNARVVVGAERYYREMYRGAVSSWNIRDTHMFDTLEALVGHLGGPVIVWAHNSHVGDARFSEMGEAGETTIGTLVRQRYGEEAMLIGQTTSVGTVTAASWWGGTAERKVVRQPLRGSYEHHLHETGLARFRVDMRDERAAFALEEPRLERAIGVIYRPETERASHYFRAIMPEQFDVVVHIDRTRALEPLEREAVWEQGEPPQTYPTAV